MLGKGGETRPRLVRTRLSQDSSQVEHAVVQYGWNIVLNEVEWRLVLVEPNDGLDREVRPVSSQRAYLRGAKMCPLEVLYGSQD